MSHEPHTSQPSSHSEANIDRADPQSRRETSALANRGLHEERRLADSSSANVGATVAIMFGVILVVAGIAVGIQLSSWIMGIALAILSVALLACGGFDIARSSRQAAE